MTSRIRLGILGGTLDPVHTGHLEAAQVARRALGLTRVVFLPSRIPPHRTVQPVASPFHRFAMACLAVNGLDGFEASDLELRVPGPTFTADTLARLHAAGFDPAQIFFITGADAFAEIATWHRFPEVLEMANFVVVSRPGHDAGQLQRLLPDLAGRMMPGGEPASASVTPTIFLVNARTPDVSSTEIRQRLTAGQPVHHLLPPAVETHIRQHGLYAAAASNALPATADHLHGQN